ncbi:hypothetical protein JGK43_002498 [Edwardsiella piscicida]|nr:hypothetical protein [Edwardsiella piscicida]ELM3729189.1 hypothetical protein [Edwardsiella piscicida]ELV7536218.1 hypothetical protein [Edwardsiella piscicida]
MISNDMIINTSSLIMLFFLLAWGGCFFVFVYKKLGEPKVSRDSLLYFNFMFFKRGALASFSISFLVLGYMSAAFVEYRREFNELILLANLMGGMSFFLFAIYGRYFYHDDIEDKKSFFFIKVFLTEIDFYFGSVFLWLSRLTYIAWLLLLIFNSCGE